MFLEVAAIFFDFDATLSAFEFGDRFKVIVLRCILIIEVHFTISINNYESGFSKIPTSYDDACNTMQIGKFQTFKKVIFPLIKSSMMASFIVVFIEVIKELPLTMVLRPFNFDTLAVLSHELVGQAQVYESAVPAMFIVSLGIVSVLILARKMVKD